MKFLKKLFKRSSEDDEDDDDFDDEDFDLEDDDRPTTTVIMDDDEDHDDDYGGGGAVDDDDDDHEDDDRPSIQDQPLAALEAQMAEDDDSLFGTGSQVEGGDDDDGPVMGQDQYDVEVDDRELDYDDDDAWDDEDEEGGGGGKGERRKKLIFAAAAAGVLILGIAGGAAFWLMGDDAEVAEAPPDDGRIQMAMPPKQGSLNAVQDDAGDRPPPGQNAAPGQATTGEAAPGQAAPGGETAAADAAGNLQGSVLTTPEAAGGSLNALAGATDGAQGVVIPSVTSVSYQRTADIERNVPLAKAPIQSLLETVSGQAKPLPKIDAQGRKPWEAYARPLTGNEQGQHVGILITGLGLSRAATLATIRKLPPEVSLVFEPYASDLDDWLLRSRLAGHEAYVALPMESQKFPSMDAGPMGLTTTVQVAENVKRLRGVLSSFAGYVGVVSSMGSKFATADGQLKPILEELKRRGLIYIDAASSKSSAVTIAQEIDLPVLKSNVVLDDPPSSSNIQRRLRNLESFVSKNATAIAMAHPYPVSIHQIQAWINTLPGKKLALVPVSSIVGKQFIE